MNWLKRRFRSLPISSDAQGLLQLATERARAYEHDYVGVEHVFLSAWALPDDHAGHRLIAGMPIDVPIFIAELEVYSRVVTGRPVPAVLPYTPRLSHVLKKAKNLARLSDALDVTVSHLLGAMAWEGNSAVAHVLRTHVYKLSKPQKEEASGHIFLALICFPGVHLFNPKEANSFRFEPRP
jgi:ATP-dependent Clp protease ATP-binding subunit ClpA